MASESGHAEDTRNGNGSFFADAHATEKHKTAKAATDTDRWPEPKVTGEKSMSTRNRGKGGEMEMEDRVANKYGSTLEIPSKPGIFRNIRHPE